MILYIKSFQDIANYPTPSDIDGIVVQGNADIGDGGDALFKRVITAGPERYAQSATGGLFELAGATRNIKQYGAKGDGIADDTAAIQAAFDAAKPSQGSDPNRGNVIFVPPGQYLISSPVKLYSGTRLVGVGYRSIFKQAGSPSALLELAQIGVAEQCRFVAVENMAFHATGETRAIKSSAVLFLNSVLRRLFFNCGFCIDLAASYSQDISIEKCMSYGPLDQLLRLRGNRNAVSELDKEGGTGSSPDPYLLFDQCSNLHLRDILIEGSGSSSKSGIKLIKSTASCNMLWFEPSISNGYALDIDDNSIVYVYFNVKHLSAAVNRIKISNSSRLYADYLDLNANNVPFTSFVEADATSYVHVKELVQRGQWDALQLDKLSSRLFVEKFRDGTSTLTTGNVPVSSPLHKGGNILQNPSFEAGLFKWSWDSSTGITATFEPSEVSSGLMARFVFTDNPTRLLYQDIPISAEQVGKVISLAVMVKVVSADALNGYAALIAYNAGITNQITSRVSPGAGWQLITKAVTPLAAGNLRVGLNLFSMGEVCVDEMAVSFGGVACPNDQKTMMLELGNKSFICATTAPTTGTWKLGDRVFNSAPSVGQPKSWVCTVAGAPGTWVSEGNL